MLLLAKTEDHAVLDSLQQLFALKGTGHRLLGYSHCQRQRFRAYPPPMGHRNHYWNC